MFAFIKEKYFGFLDLLDRLSGGVCKRTFVFNNSQFSREMAASQFLTTGFRLGVWLEAILVLLISASLAYFSRGGQFDVMATSLPDYFLSELRNVSTTHDAGHFMFQAIEWVNALQAGKTLLDVDAAQLPPFIIAKIALLLQVSLEEAGRIMVYASVTVTAFSGYLMMLALRQSTLGILLACGIIFFFPILSRTSLGMIDTDQLNLFFFLSIIASLAFSARSRTLQSAVVFSLAAALLTQAFYLWYPRSAFLLTFAIAYFLMMLAYRAKLKTLLVCVPLFVFSSGAGQLSGVGQALVAFWDVYVQRGPVPLIATSMELSSGLDLQTVLFSTIGEISKVSVDLIRNDFGSVTALVIGILGFLVWGLQDWKRYVVVSPLLPFLVLYFTSGVRFSFFATPLIIIGLGVAATTIPLLLWKVALALLNKGGVHLKALVPRLKVQYQSIFRRESNTLGAMVRSFSFVVITAVAASWTNIIPPTIVPPPVIRATEVSMIQRSLKNVKNDEAIIASWWDYGYELRYQTRIAPVTDGGNPANIKNIYLARALISTDSAFAADEIRFASYFDPKTLSDHFPKRPTLDKAVGVEKDIYIFLPSDLQDKMITIFNIAATTFNQSALTNYNSDDSAFTVLYHKRPEVWGPFVLVAAEKDGAVLYRLPAPNMPKR